jgi:hypothetical protein
MTTGRLASALVRRPDHRLAIAFCCLFNNRYLQIVIKIYLDFCIDPANINRPWLFAMGSGRMGDVKVPWTCPPPWLAQLQPMARGLRSKQLKKLAIGSGTEPS